VGQACSDFLILKLSSRLLGQAIFILYIYIPILIYKGKTPLQNARAPCLSGTKISTQDQDRMSIFSRSYPEEKRQFSWCSEAKKTADRSRRHKIKKRYP